MRQKVQQFLTAACSGNLDLLKSKFFSFLSILWAHIDFWLRMFLCICIFVIWDLFCM